MPHAVLGCHNVYVDVQSDSIEPCMAVQYCINARLIVTPAVMQCHVICAVAVNHMADTE